MTGRLANLLMALDWQTYDSTTALRLADPLYDTTTELADPLWHYGTTSGKLADPLYDIMTKSWQTRYDPSTSRTQGSGKVLGLSHPALAHNGRSTRGKHSTRHPCSMHQVSV